MDGTGDDHEFLVVRVFAVFDHVGIGVFAEIAGMGVLAVNQKDCASDLIGILKDRLVDKALAADDVPAAVGIQGTGVIASLSFVIVVVILHKERRVFRKRIDHTAAKFILAVFQILKSLGAHGGFCLVTGLLAVGGIEISLGVHTGHIVHGRSHCRLDPGIQRGCIDGHAAPAADADDADAFRIGFFMKGEEVHSRHEVLGVDVG